MSEIDTKNNTREILSDLSLLPCTRNLSSQAREKIATTSVKKKFSLNEYIWESGASGDFVAIVTKGLIEVVRFSADQEGELLMGIFGRSDVLGLSAVTKKISYPGSAKCLKNSTEIIKFYLRTALQSSETEIASEISLWVRDMLLLHEQVLYEKIDILNAKTVARKVYELLNHLVRRFGFFTPDSYCCVDVGITKSQIAKMTDTRVETIIRLFSQWEKQGIVHWKKEGIVIPDMRCLAKLVYFQEKNKK